MKPDTTQPTAPGEWPKMPIGPDPIYRETTISPSDERVYAGNQQRGIEVRQAYGFGPHMQIRMWDSGRDERAELYLRLDEAKAVGEWLCKRVREHERKFRPGLRGWLGRQLGL